MSKQRFGCQGKRGAKKTEKGKRKAGEKTKSNKEYYKISKYQ